MAALVAFAANSLLCRMALASSAIDPWSFTLIRLVSAAVCLVIIVAVSRYSKNKQAMTVHGCKPKAVINTAKNVIANNITNNTYFNELLKNGNWFSSVCLWMYALCFSLAYVALDTATGALILFSAVQLTMIGWGIYQKERLNAYQWVAFLVAISGFVYIMLPSAVMPSLTSAILMAVSGVAWGIYSIRGKACASPLHATTGNFLRSLAVAPLLLFMALLNAKTITVDGILLAVASGALASGLGYSLWYMALSQIKTTQAAIVQLCVPLLAAIMGVVFLTETMSVRFIIASIIILGAVLVFIISQKYQPKPC